MAIRVTCPGCMTRFQVSDQYAGRTGPCPKCKKEIKIPEKGSEVKIHERESHGPKDSKGRSVLKPIFREETRISVPVIVAIVLTIVVAIVGAVVLRVMHPQGEGLAPFPMWPLIAGAILLAVPLVLGGYTVLRDQELEGYRGQALWMRVLICAAIYAVLWFAFPAAAFAFTGYTVVSLIAASVFMFGIGGLIALAAFEFEYLNGVIHFGFYFAGCILLRWIATSSALPFDG